MTEKILWNEQIKYIQPLKRQKNKDEALEVLKKLACAVKEIMKRYNWSVGLLKEFYPRNTRLLGQNVNRETICIRLRNSYDPDSFLNWENVLKTMLHELVHMRITPHNVAFYKLLDQLWDEQENDERRGLIHYGGNFSGKSYKLGDGNNSQGVQNYNQNVPPNRSLILQAAENRQKSSQLQNHGGRKLGGSYIKGAIRKPKRDVLADAAERRQRDEARCGTTENSFNVGEDSIEIIEIEDGRDENNAQDLQWSCTSCTYLNHIVMEVCEMCEQPKQKKIRV
eukprot:TRINITY_DN4575_c0_g2_i2.p1 TRINITY_DN4575_c0_g2~~TRINITY_DN4575_c0_g2_i2.p1  ORF type:complete len:281 (+),score=42.24 TRINITY_DN4575_c0_g2_i2:364-1206(+)